MRRTRTLNPKTKASLDDVISRFYEAGVELRAKLLSESPGMLGEQYKLEIYKILVPFQNDLMGRFAPDLVRHELMYLYRGLDQTRLKVMAMPTKADISSRGSLDGTDK